ncbi:MAG: diguanylate cyclase [Myxococcales bacterium]|nr:diguanylate cyclase [Myxococcales bacterium]
MDEAQKILVVEDDAVTRARLAFLLRKNGYQVDVADDGDSGWIRFQELHYPIVLTDWLMPGLSGPELCERIRRYEGEVYTYVILITGKTEKSNIALGLEAGADDYVTKPFDSGELLARLRTGRRILDLQASMREAKRQLQDLASRDGLTEVLNRRALEERLAEAFTYFLRRGTPLSIAMLDLDHFKQINDNYGHQAGDDVLREAARRVTSMIREYDTIGRYGGEEFLVLLPDTPGEEATSIAERIRRSIAELPVETRDGGTIHASVSVGLATAHAGFRGNVKDVIESADAALYRAKRGGRNRVEHGVGEGIAGAPRSALG